jgi:opacity protein-like surface antigen
MKGFSKGIGVVIVLCCALGLSLPSQAENKLLNYVVARGGIYSPQTNDLNGFDAGFNGEVAVGRYFDKNWVLEGSIGNFETSGKKDLWLTPGSSPRTVHFSVVPVTVAFKGLILVDKFEFYGLGGIGAYFLGTDTNSTDDSRKRHDSDGDSETLFGGFLGLGATFNFTPRLFVGVEGKYLWTTTATVINAKMNLNGILATAGIGFRF